MRMAVETGFHAAVFRHETQPWSDDQTGQTIEHWLQVLHARSDPRATFAVLTWPMRRRRARVYVHLMDERGVAVSFAKISLDQHNCDLACREAAVLRSDELRKQRCFRVPRLLLHAESGHESILVTDAAPATARPPAKKENRAARSLAEVSEALRSLSGGVRVRPLDDPGPSRWWKRFQEVAPTLDGAFVSDVLAAAEHPTPLVLAHGDLCISNILTEGPTTWLVDWEFSDTHAPLLTDAIGIDLGRNLRSNMARPERGQRLLARRYLENQETDVQRNVILALAYRAAFGFDDVRALTRNWRTTLL